jgi:sugar phosphate isomerase/epimerase
MTAIAGTGISLGTTLYSFTSEWVSGQYDLRSLLNVVASRGIGPGVEIVGFQSIRSYPDVTDSFVHDWRSAIDELGLEPSALGSNIDVALRADRFLTTEEMTDYLTVQIEAARRLKFPTLRIQMGATPDVLEAAAPIAERAGVTLGMEIHAPEGALTPAVLKVRELYDRLQSPRLGFIPDFSSTMRAVPAGFRAMGRKEGVSEEMLDALEKRWAEDGAPLDRYLAWAETARSAGTSAAAIGRMQLAFTMFGHEPMDSWAELIPQTVHVHGKFYGVTDGVEQSIDYPRAMRLLVDGGYEGYISSEWEGHGFTDLGEVDPAELIQAHHALETSAISAAASELAR